MDEFEGYKILLKKRLTAKRYTHTLAVAQTAAKLAELFEGQADQAYLTGLLHDYARDLTPSQLLIMAQDHDLVEDHVEVVNPNLLHGKVGAFLLEQEGIIDDQEILQAIRYHTTGYPEMGKLDKIIYIADYIEPGRDFPGVEKMRQVAYQNLDFGLLSGLDHTIMYLLQSAAFIHPLSIATRNRMIELINIQHCN